MNALLNKIIIETLLHARKYKLSDDFIAFIEKKIRSSDLDIKELNCIKITLPKRIGKSFLDITSALYPMCGIIHIRSGTRLHSIII